MTFGHVADPLFGSKKTYRIALLGAESSGKTTLATELTTALRELGYNAGMVPEYLRTWCKENSRLPEFDDQGVILEGTSFGEMQQLSLMFWCVIRPQLRPVSTQWNILDPIFTWSGT